MRLNQALRTRLMDCDDARAKKNVTILTWSNLSSNRSRMLQGDLGTTRNMYTNINVINDS